MTKPASVSKHLRIQLDVMKPVQPVRGGNREPHTDNKPPPSSTRHRLQRPHAGFTDVWSISVCWSLYETCWLFKADNLQTAYWHLRRCAAASNCWNGCWVYRGANGPVVKTGLSEFPRVITEGPPVAHACFCARFLMTDEVGATRCAPQIQAPRWWNENNGSGCCSAPVLLLPLLSLSPLNAAL